MSELRLRSTDGLELEARLDSPPTPTGAIMLCHPHPQMGGTMNAPLLLSLVEAFAAASWAVLRFNFRGVGASEGAPGDGTDEVADAAGALRHLRDEFPNLPVAIVGWSFGAAVAVRVLVSADVSACVAIAPPVVDRPSVSAGLPNPRKVPAEIPLMVVSAALDRTVDPLASESWAKDAGASHVAIAGANHLFWAKYEDLAASVVRWLRNSL